MAQQNLSRGAGWLLVAAAVLGLAISIFDFLYTGNGIHGTVGVGIVIGSTVLMVAASAAIALGWASGWVRGVLAALILLDILGTGFAAYMLEDYVLVGVMGLALLAWLFLLLAGGSRRRVSAPVEAAS
jgi:quinoprotein glucose dehydrogenase